MAFPVKPTLILQMDFDEACFTEWLVADIKRSYAHIAATLIKSHPAAQQPENTMRMTIRLHRPYWDKNDAVSEENWTASMQKWLHNMIAKVSNNIVAANKINAERGMDVVEYAWLECNFEGNMVIAMRNNPETGFPAGAVALVEQARALAVDGAFGEGVACVRMPSRASLAEQCAAAMEGAAAAATTAAEGEEGEPGAEVLAQGAPFACDYVVWGIEYADGTVREFNSRSGGFVE